ncbi:MAG: c-type cytochrome [Rhodospirillaceae bacterium]|nr:c-type cytochrome [Rhodospirillaceae bacterium]
MLALVTVWLAIPGAPGQAQDLQEILDQGEQTFLVTCATGYCHAAGGALGGGASRLAGRGFDQDYIRRATLRGLTGTAMPGFGEVLSTEEINAVVAYVAVLNDIANPSVGDMVLEGTAPAASELSDEAVEGRALFHESVRGFTRCATCHRVAGSGVPAANPMLNVPADAAALRAMATLDSVSTATVGRESMPALLVSAGASRTMFYDFTSPPPVLRTVDNDDVSLEPGNPWRHDQVLGTYSDPELERILEYLRAVVQIN